MKKSDRLSAYVATLGSDPALALHPCYQGWFTCFNAGDYYEAHDVLEHLWLQQRGGENDTFFKGLIQLAGAYVHLKNQHLHPAHPKHGRRLHPAARLFLLASQNLAPFAPTHLHLDVTAVRKRCTEAAFQITASDFAVNPWSPENLPRIELMDQVEDIS